MDKPIRIDKIIQLIIAEALDLERNTPLDFVGALNKVQLSISARVIKLMENKRAEERKKKNE